MRERDVRALAFCVVSTLVVAAAAYFILRSALIAALLTLGYDAFILTRPRMLRIYRRLRGEVIEPFSYHRD